MGNSCRICLQFFLTMEHLSTKHLTDSVFGKLLGRHGCQRDLNPSKIGGREIFNRILGYDLGNLIAEKKMFFNDHENQVRINILDIL